MTLQIGVHSFARWRRICAGGGMRCPDPDQLSDTLRVGHTTTLPTLPLTQLVSTTTLLQKICIMYRKINSIDCTRVRVGVCSIMDFVELALPLDDFPAVVHLDLDCRVVLGGIAGGSRFALVLGLQFALRGSLLHVPFDDACVREGCDRPESGIVPAENLKRTPANHSSKIPRKSIAYLNHTSRRRGPALAAPPRPSCPG